MLYLVFKTLNKLNANTCCVRIRIPQNGALSKPVPLGNADTLKVALTAQEGKSAKNAHQVFLLLEDPNSGLDISYPFSVKGNGKSRVELVWSLQLLSG